jgi:DnaJ-domain-containing protein 1
MHCHRNLAWENYGKVDREYRRAAELKALLNAPQPDSSAWWEVLGVAPSTPDEAIRTAYIELLKQCHSDRVSGLAPEFIQLAEKMTSKLDRAFDESGRRPAWWAE